MIYHDSDTRAGSDIAVDARIPFLDAITIDHGPLQLLGRFFAEGDNLLRHSGIQVVMGSLADAVATQEANDNSWHSYPPMLDPRLSRTDADSSFCLLGVDPSGRVVTVQAGRMFSGADTLETWIRSGRFIYGDAPTPGPHFVFSIESPSAARIRSPFVYSGGLWVHPAYRGSKLAGVLVRLSRAYALARWNTAYTIAFVSEAMARGPMPSVYGYSKLEPGIVSRNLPDGSTWSGELMWMDRDELVTDLTHFLLDRLPQINARIVDRSANQQP